MPTYGRYFTETDTNAYLCQMWVQLDFDIIDLTFTKNGVETVIPVIMSPMDIAADGTSPLITTKDGISWWKIILGIIAFFVIVILLLKFAPAVVYVIGKVIAFPFKCIGALFKGMGNSIKRRREKKAEKADNVQEKEVKRKRKGKNENLTSEEYFDFEDMDFDDDFWKMLDGLDY